MRFFVMAVATTLLSTTTCAFHRNHHDISRSSFPSGCQASGLRLQMLPLSMDSSNLLLDATTSPSHQTLQSVTSSLTLAHAPVAQVEAATLSYSPAIGSSLIMLSIVGLLYLWEVSVEWMRETVPKALLPVVESILAEIGGLGFIGLVLQSILGNEQVKESLEGASEYFFQDPELLVENFEFLHAAFFQVGIAFFMAVGAMTVVGLKKLKEIKTVEALQLDQIDSENCTVTATLLAQYLPEKDVDGSDVQNIGQANIWEDIAMEKEERAARAILMRIQVMKIFTYLPETFRVETLLQASFAQNLFKLVEVSPLTWLYLIPALALANAIDLSHDVVNAASPNAAASAGFFYSTPTALIPNVLIVSLSTAWGLWNCWKLTNIKYMLWPRIGKTENEEEYEFLPAFVDSESDRKKFDSSPWFVEPIERLWSKPATNPLEDLFGEAGSNGMPLYQNSLKYQTWLCITQVVFFGTQVVPRDLGALYSQASVGDPDHLVAELVTYGSFVLISVLQLLFISPRAFWNYCLISGVEEKRLLKLLELSGNAQQDLSGTTAPLVATNSTSSCTF